MAVVYLFVSAIHDMQFSRDPRYSIQNGLLVGLFGALAASVGEGLRRDGCLSSASSFVAQYNGMLVQVGVFVAFDLCV